jgi:hypothetical protein
MARLGGISMLTRGLGIEELSDTYMGELNEILGFNRDLVLTAVV